MKPLRDYEKVRRFVGYCRRNLAFQARHPRLQSLDYLHAGCGPQIVAGFVNLDYRWVPGVDVVWDLSRRLPFPSKRFAGLFTEHCLEHFDETALAGILQEFHRVLRPGGRIRVVVPCLETHARRYLETRAEADAGPARLINRVFYSGHDWMRRSHWNNDGHHFIHDHASLATCLKAAGFTDIRRCSFGQGMDVRLLIDRADRAWESLYVEAIKPPAPAP